MVSVDASELWFVLFLGVLGVERMFELRLSARNAAWAFEQGGIEYGHTHFRWMKVLHFAFFGGCLLEVLVLGRTFLPWLGWPMLALAAMAQGLRYWAIASLGKSWNVRVIVVPDRDAVASGPYRFMRHPNYLAVIVEGFAVPLVHGAYLTALLFSLFNAWVLHVRIRCEEHALAKHCRYDAVLGGRRRFVPGSSEPA